MIDYRELLRLNSMGLSFIAIGNCLGCSRNKVSEIVHLEEKQGLEWPISDKLTNADLEALFYPRRGNNEGRQIPDFEYIYNELAKPGVTLTLLWAEYCAKCADEHTIPYQHTQFSENVNFQTNLLTSK